MDITDLPENWLETDEFADLRELIRVTNDDVHTFDVVYGDDMAAQRRVAEGRMVCEDGRFITPADAGQPVCVVSTDFLEMSGLKIGDSITLDLGNYLSEQYAPLGAVAVTRGRQNTEYTRQEFTIIGSWRDLNEGNHVFRDRYWCWSKGHTPLLLFGLAALSLSFHLLIGVSLTMHYVGFVVRYKAQAAFARPSFMCGMSALSMP